MPLTITLNEFGRRLCVAEHPMYGTTNNRVPCAVHSAMASRYWGLIRAEGRVLLDVIEQVRSESGMGAVQSVDIRD